MSTNRLFWVQTFLWGVVRFKWAFDKFVATRDHFTSMAHCLGIRKSSISLLV